MSDPQTTRPPAPAAAVGGGASPSQPASALAGQPAAPAAAPAAPRVAPEAFGGHRGGGKKREDGLPAGSEAARQADREKDAARKRAARLAAKAAALPAPLPSAAAPGAGLPAAAPLAAAPLVPWTPALLKKPCELITRIGDRLRTGVVAKRLDNPVIPAELRQEIRAELELPDKVLADFSEALNHAATVELNKRGVGAGQAHLIALTACAAEIGTHTLQSLARIDALIAKAEQQAPNQEGRKAGMEAKA